MNTAARIAELEQINAQLAAQMAAMKQQLDWFRRQLFGQKSEKQLTIDPAVQGNLLDALGVPAPAQKSSPPPGSRSPTRAGARCAMRR